MENDTITLVIEDVETDETDDFFSDAVLDAENAVTGKTCNIWDPECEACQ